MLALSISLFSCGSSKKTKSSRSKSKSKNTATRPSPKSTKTSTSSIQQKYATKLQVKPSQVRNAQLYSFVNSWEGTPYRYGGMSKSGADCSGFSNVLYKEVYRKQLPRTTKDIYSSCRKVGKGELREGDLVFFDIQGKKKSHMGVYLQNNRFVHASSSKGVVISDLNNPYYKKYFSGGGRPR